MVLLRILVVLSAIAYVSAKNSSSMTCSCIRKITPEPTITTISKFTTSNVATKKTPKFTTSNVATKKTAKFTIQIAATIKIPKPTVKTVTTTTTLNPITSTAATTTTTTFISSTTVTTTTPKYTSSFEATTTTPVSTTDSVDSTSKLVIIRSSKNTINANSDMFGELWSTPILFVGLGIVSGISAVGIFVYQLFSNEHGAYKVFT